MRRFVTLAIGAVLVAPASAFVYSADDGVAEANYGNANGGSMMWLNHFTVQPGGTVINQVLGAFGNVPNGAAVTAHLWSDPNGDGNPIDAVSLASGSSVTANALTNTFNAFTIPTIVRPVGTSFFVGFRMSFAAGMTPARVDMTVPHGQSWMVVGNSPNNLSGAVAYDGNWLIRANAVPEPTSVIALAAGAAALLRRRRKA
ncbi:MAG: PEP-CTERM sorting domain-containing protein [Fimbriimonadaceae bacterium]|nr:PEP-CTERM sorting domain-containing protein [Fimbriimonadaceae bacterium]